MGKYRKRFGFTLIELLIVISIIAILAAMLLPSLIRAKRQATLVVCLNTLKQNGIAFTMYAHDNDDNFPDLSDHTITWYRWILSYEPNYDHRPVFREILGDDLNVSLLCPLSPTSIPIGTGGGIEGSAYSTYIGTKLWVGDQYHMNKLGREVEYSGEIFSVMMGDMFLTDSSNNNFRTSHNASYTSHGKHPSLPLFYWTGVTPGVGNIDRNFVFQDGHAETLRNITWNGSHNVNHSRIMRVSTWLTGQSLGRYGDWAPFDE